GVNVQVACTLDGRLVWVSTPFEGRHHDIHCLRKSGILQGRDTTSWLADKGYIGSDMITPFRKPRKREQPRWQKEYNFQHNKIRVAVERAIAHLKTWRILHTDYRRPFNTFTATITAVIGLYFYARSE
ncbi:transposase family protein, partial [Actinokineospora diospyrosa]